MSARAAAVAVADHAFSCGATLPWSAVYAAETYTLLGAPEPFAHGPAIAMARSEVGAEGEEYIRGWLADHRPWVEAAGGALTALDELETDPIPAAPREAELVGELAERAAVGAPLAEVIWAGFCARSQWLWRFGGADTACARLISADPFAENAFQVLSGERCTEIATGVHARLRELAAEAEAAEAEMEAGR